MRYLKKTGFVFFLVIFCWTSWGFGQTYKDSEDPREKARARIQMIKRMRLTEALKLDQETAARFFSLSHHFEGTKRMMHKDFQEDIQRLRGLLKDPNPPEKDLKELILRLKNRKKDMEVLSERQTNEEMNLLRPDQQGRYILFQIDFRKEISNILREPRGEK
jgi:hypothetical protein